MANFRLEMSNFRLEMQMFSKDLGGGFEAFQGVASEPKGFVTPKP